MSVSITPQERPQILDNCVLFMLEFGRLGNSKSVDTTDLDVDADKDQLRLSKSLLESPELQAITKMDNAFRKYVMSRCLPSFIKAGVYLLPLRNLNDVEKRFSQFQEERAAAIAEFISVYPTRKREAANKLRALYDESEYPEPDEIEEKFHVKRQYLEFNVPGKLAKYSPELFKQQQNEMLAKWSEAEEKVTLLLRQNAQELVDALVERLTPEPGGKRKIFRDTITENLREFIQQFRNRNVTDDTELQRIIDKCDELLKGVKADDLRADAKLKAKVQNGFSRIQDELSSLVVTGGKRNINYDADELIDDDILF
jgi:ElaB/YqjD/DUF883 family membrane-anchored ribosome-binding protein